MERSRLTYEVTNQQLMAVITKLSSQLARAKLPPPPPQQQQQLGSKPSTVVTPAAASPAVSGAAPSSSSSSSSFRRQKGIRMKKRDSVRRSPGLVGDSQSCTSSDSGNYSDNNTDTSLQAADGHNNNSSNSSHLQKLLRKGLHLVSSVNQELSRATPTAGEEKTRRPDNGCKDHLSSTISRSGGNTNKVIIKIQSGHCAPDTAPGPSPPRHPVSPMVGGGKSVNVGEIRTDAVSGCVRVPVPYRCTYYDV